MNYKYYVLKISTIIVTLLATVFMFFDWITIDMPILKADTASLMTFTDKVLEEQENSGSLIDVIVHQSGVIAYAKTKDFAASESIAKNIGIGFLIGCGTLKYAMFLSVGFALYGIVKCFILKKKTYFIMTSQIISLVIQFLLYVFFIIYNSIDFSVSVFKANEVLTIVPTYLMAGATVVSIASLVLSVVYQRRYSVDS